MLRFSTGKLAKLTLLANFKIYNAKDKYLISANFSFNKYAYASAQSGIKF